MQNVKKFLSVFLAVLMLVCSVPFGNYDLSLFDVKASAISQSVFDSKLNELRSKYPNYSTWTGTYGGGSQCWGFARLVADYVFDESYTTWSTVYSISGVKAGDILQYGNTSGSGHTVFVTAVSGDTIYFVDCNGNGNYSGGTKVRSCGIKWDNSISKGSAMFGKYSFSYLLSSPDFSGVSGEASPKMIDFYWISNSDNSDAWIDISDTPMVSAVKKFWFKEIDEDTNYYIDMYIDDVQVLSYASSDENGYVSYTIDTGTLSNGIHKIKAVLVDTNGIYEAEKSFYVNNLVEFFWISNSDNSEAWIDISGTPHVTGERKFWFKKTSTDTNYYIDIYLDENQVVDHGTADNAGYISYVIDTGTMEDGLHSIKCVLFDTQTSYTATKDFYVNNLVRFHGISTADNSQWFDASGTPTVYGERKFWFKKESTDSNYYFDLYIDGVKQEHNMPADSDDWYSYTLNTFNLENGSHTIRAELFDSVGYYTATKSFVVNNSKYTATFNPNGGSCSTASKAVIYASTYGTLPTPTRTGYTFDGWYTAASGGTKITSSSTVSTAGNHTLYAHWTANTYTVTFNANGGSCSTSSKTVTYSNTYATLPTPTKTGYTFDGWYTAASGGTKITSSSTVSTAGNHTLYARWTANTYTVTFNANGGSTPTSSKSVTYNSTYGTLPTPTRTGYTFDGWYTAASGGTKITSSSTVSTAGNHTLYAQWSANTYYVKYNANGGKGTMENSTHTFGVSKALTANTFTRTGYTFLGWARSKSATTPDYVDGKKVSGLTGVEGKTVVLYAVWKPINYSVKYNANGGTGTMSNSSHTFGTAKALSANKFTRTGYTFLGWSKTKTATTASYVDCREVSGLTGVEGKTVVLYAVWKPINYSVKYHANGGTGTMSNSSHTFGTAKELSANKFTRTGYTFLGWSKTKNATTASYTDEQVVKGLTGVEGKTVVLYAVWKPINYSVKYNANGGTGTMANSAHTFGTSKALSANKFTRTGYTFLGWSRTKNATTATYTNKQVVKGLTGVQGKTVTLYAVWQKK